MFPLVPQQAVGGMAGVVRREEREVECPEQWVGPKRQAVTMTTHGELYYLMYAAKNNIGFI